MSATDLEKIQIIQDRVRADLLRLLALGDLAGLGHHWRTRIERALADLEAGDTIVTAVLR